jgi:hypothetical protein
MKDIVCTFWEVPCRFCSEESTFCACTYIQKKDGHYIGVKIGYIKSERGQYCNNIGVWIKDIKYCPARWALTSGNDIVEVVKRKYTKKSVVEKPKRKYVKKEKVIPKRKYVKKDSIVEKPKRKYVKKDPTIVKKKPVVKKAIPKRKKEIINI